MTTEKIKVVYSCCGQYLVPMNKNAGKAIVCPRCGQKQEQAIELPKILLFK